MAKKEAELVTDNSKQVELPAHVLAEVAEVDALADVAPVIDKQGEQVAQSAQDQALGECKMLVGLVRTIALSVRPRWEPALTQSACDQIAVALVPVLDMYGLSVGAVFSHPLFGLAAACAVPGLAIVEIERQHAQAVAVAEAARRSGGKVVGGGDVQQPG